MPRMFCMSTNNTASAGSSLLPLFILCRLTFISSKRLLASSTSLGDRSMPLMYLICMERVPYTFEQVCTSIAYTQSCNTPEHQPISRYPRHAHKPSPASYQRHQQICIALSCGACVRVLSCNTSANDEPVDQLALDIVMKLFQGQRRTFFTRTKCLGGVSEDFIYGSQETQIC